MWLLFCNLITSESIKFICCQRSDVSFWSSPCMLQNILPVGFKSKPKKTCTVSFYLEKREWISEEKKWKNLSRSENIDKESRRVYNRRCNQAVYDMLMVINLAWLALELVQQEPLRKHSACNDLRQSLINCNWAASRMQSWAAREFVKFNYFLSVNQVQNKLEQMLRWFQL